MLRTCHELGTSDPRTSDLGPRTFAYQATGVLLGLTLSYRWVIASSHELVVTITP
jgi:hypothetical protein